MNEEREITESMETAHFEQVIIGGGKAGKTLAMKMASEGRNVALIEKGMIGGSCINVACIPTKTMVKSAKVRHLVRRAGDFGWRTELQAADFSRIRERKRSIVEKMVEKNRANFEQSGMTLIIGTARFKEDREIEVQLSEGGTRILTGEQIFINTGTRPSIPQIAGLDGVKPLNSESIQELESLPNHLIILGGGSIGCEFAQMFRRFGSRVTLIEREKSFLPHEETEISEQIHQIFSEDGIDILLGTTVKEVEGESGKAVRVKAENASAEHIVEGSDLLIAMGRAPNTEELNVSAAGIELDEDGFVMVNDHLETTADNIWAMGDVNGGPQFTHVSLDDFRIISSNLTGKNRSRSDRLICYTLFTDPELGRVGLTEEEARSQGYRVKAARMAAEEIPRANTSGETRGYLKAVVDSDTDQILGASILSAAGGEVMSVIQVAMKAGMTASELSDTIFSHPTMAEGLNSLFGQLA